MKICTVHGNFNSEKSSEQYPSDLFCEECFQSMHPDKEDSSIVSHQDDDGSYGDTCSSCGKTKEEEI